jgi:DNA uptake protein ComE-like DNA-binding protein
VLQMQRVLTPSWAAKIATDRATRGRFTSFADLQRRVSGLGAQKLGALQGAFELG